MVKITMQNALCAVQNAMLTLLQEILTSEPTKKVKGNINFVKGAFAKMADIETVINGLNDIGEFIAGRVGFEQARNFLRTIDDALTLLEKQEAVKPQDAEMLIIHNSGAEEYVKDIESIVLLAHKDYDIVYCGRFSEGR
jgi:hypothetical protein